MIKVFTLHAGWDVVSLKKGGWGLFYLDQRVKDPMNQTGLGKRFDTPGEAALALDTCDFNPLTDPR